MVCRHLGLFDKQGVTQIEANWSNCVLACAWILAYVETRRNGCEALKSGKQVISEGIH